MKLIVRLFEDDGTVADQRAAVANSATYEVRPSFNEDEIIKNAKDANFIIVGYEQITRKVIESLPNLEMICFQSIGFNGVDLEAANEHKIPVCHIGTYCIPEVADYTLATILAANRHLLDFNNSVKNGKKWLYDEFADMKRLSNQVVGLVGFGNIPKAISQRLSVFGPQVIAYDPFVSQEIMDQYHVRKVELAELFANADYISLHLPLTPETNQSINSELFKLTTRKPVLINSARGAIVNERDLVQALDAGHISYAYLDVLTSEFPDLENDPLVNHPRTVITPHSAFYSLDSMRQSGLDSIANVVNYLQGEMNKVQIVNRRQIGLN